MGLQNSMANRFCVDRLHFQLHLSWTIWQMLWSDDAKMMPKNDAEKCFKTGNFGAWELKATGIWGRIWNLELFER